MGKYKKKKKKKTKAFSLFDKSCKNNGYADQNDKIGLIELFYRVQLMAYEHSKFLLTNLSKRK